MILIRKLKTLLEFFRLVISNKNLNKVILIMADLSDVYGQNFQLEAQQSRVEYLLNNIANNIGHRQFKFRLNDTQELWNQLQNMNDPHITFLINKIKNINKKLYVIHLKKGTEQINMLPELIIDTPIEYFLIIDSEYGRAYFIYITPSEVNSY